MILSFLGITASPGGGYEWRGLEVIGSLLMSAVASICSPVRDGIDDDDEVLGIG